MKFERRIDRFGEKTALIDGEREISYARLAQWSDDLAGTLPEGRHLLAIAARSDAETVAAYLGALRHGHAVMMLDASLAPEVYGKIVETYRPNLLFDSAEDGGWRPFDPEPAELHASLALLLGTSGTTGDRKMVRLSLENLHANCGSILRYLPIGGDDRVTAHLPLHYSYGLSVLHTHLAKGATVVLGGEMSILSRAFWERFERYRITNFNGVPYHYEMLLRAGFLEREYPHLRFMTQAGGKLLKERVERFSTHLKSRGVDFYVMYGQTEATARIAYVPPASLPKKAGAIGLPIPGVSLSVESGADAEHPAELVCEGPNVMLGYAKCREDLALGDVLGGRLRTGDIGYRDSEGYFYVTGRSKRFIKMHGHRVSLDHIEQILRGEGYEILCGGEDDRLLLVTRKEEEKELKEAVARLFGFYHRSVKVVKVDAFPVKPTGKIDYGALRRYL